MGRALVVWGPSLVVVLVVLGLWVIAGETGYHPAPPTIPRQTLATEVELPARSEVWTIEAGPEITLTY